MKYNIDKILVIMFMLLGLFIFIYNNNKSTKSKNKTINMIEDEHMRVVNEEPDVLPNDYKKDIIYNKPKILEPRYDEISKTLYSIQYLYILHPELFENIVDNLDYFITIYEDILENIQSKKYNYVGYEIELLNNIKKIIINDIDQFTLTVSYNEMALIKQHKKDFINVLTQYINRTRKFYKELLDKYGYFTGTKMIVDDTEPVPLDEVKMFDSTK